MTADEAQAYAELLEIWDACRGNGPRPYDILSISRPYATLIGDGQVPARVSQIFRAIRALGARAATDVIQRTLGKELTRHQRMKLMRAICAFGTRGKSSFRAAYRAKERQLREDVNDLLLESPGTRQRGSGGVSVAQFLSRTGLPVLLVMRGSTMDGMIEVTAANGWAYRQHEDADVQRDTIRTARDAAGLVQHFNLLLHEGVHDAPWRHDASPRGGSWIAVDRDHCLVAVVDYADANGRESAEQDAEAVLDMCRARYQPTRDLPSAPGIWHDPYDDGHTDDSDGCGDNWMK